MHADLGQAGVIHGGVVRAGFDNVRGELVFTSPLSGRQVRLGGLYLKYGRDSDVSFSGDRHIRWGADDRVRVCGLHLN